VYLDVLGYLAAAGAGGAAGAINSLAGGGTVVSFSTLVALGVPPVTANVTNTVSLVPGYLTGAWAQRHDLRLQVRDARALAVAALAGGLCGSVILVTIPAHAFEVVVPYLILLACALLLVQDWLHEHLRPIGNQSNAPDHNDDDKGTASTRQSDAAPVPEGGAIDVRRAQAPARLEYVHPLLIAAVFAAAMYGGFFGAGLGIMLMAVLGLLTTQPLLQVNALKQALGFVVNMVAAGFFAISGHVAWELVPVIGVAAMAGAVFGTRLVRTIRPSHLRLAVVVVGVAVAVAFWVE
jgi:uncharacterized membrane protein YfcA